MSKPSHNSTPEIIYSLFADENRDRFLESKITFIINELRTDLKEDGLAKDFKGKAPISITRIKAADIAIIDANAIYKFFRENYPQDFARLYETGVEQENVEKFLAAISDISASIRSDESNNVPGEENLWEKFAIHRAKNSEKIKLLAQNLEQGITGEPDPRQNAFGYLYNLAQKFADDDRASLDVTMLPRGEKTQTMNLVAENKNLFAQFQQNVDADFILRDAVLVTEKASPYWLRKYVSDSKNESRAQFPKAVQQKLEPILNKIYQEFDRAITAANGDPFKTLEAIAQKARRLYLTHPIQDGNSRVILDSELRYDLNKHGFPLLKNISTSAQTRFEGGEIDPFYFKEEMMMHLVKGMEAAQETSILLGQNDANYNAPARLETLNSVIQDERYQNLVTASNLAKASNYQAGSASAYVADPYPPLEEMRQKFPKTYARFSSLVADLGDDEKARAMVIEALGLTKQTVAPNGQPLYSSNAAKFSDNETVAESLGLLRNGQITGKYVAEEDGDLKAEQNPAKFNPHRFLPQIPQSVEVLGNYAPFRNLVTQLNSDLQEMENIIEKESRKALADHRAADKTGGSLESFTRSLEPIEEHLAKMMGSFADLGFGTDEDKMRAYGLCLKSCPEFAAEHMLYTAAYANSETGASEMATEYDNALKSYEKAADKGDAKAAMALGYIHAFGCEEMGVQPNLELAKGYFMLGGDKLLPEIKSLEEESRQTEKEPSGIFAKLLSVLKSIFLAIFGEEEISREMSPAEIAASDALGTVKAALHSNDRNPQTAENENAISRILADRNQTHLTLHANPQREEISRNLQDLATQYQGKDLVDKVNQFFFTRTADGAVDVEEVGHDGEIGSIKGDALEVLQTILFNASHSHYDSDELPIFYQKIIGEFAKVLVDPSSINGKEELENLATALGNLQKTFPNMEDSLESGHKRFLEKFGNTHEAQPSYVPFANKIPSTQVVNSSSAEPLKENKTWVEKLNLSKKSERSNVEKLEEAKDRHGGHHGIEA
jgi:TPR repeat protein